MTNIDDFLAHYGVLGMRWGKRKAEKKTQKERDRAARKELMRGKDLDEIFARNRKEKKLNRLIEEDLHPRKVASKKFVNDLMKENGIALVPTLLTGASIAAGVGFMALRLSGKFKGISTSAIPLS